MLLREVRGALASRPELGVTAHGRIWVDVPLGARRHRVRVTGADEWLRVEARVVSMADVAAAPRVADLALRLLRANRAAELVGLARDEDELVARCDVPPEADADELVDAIYRVARVADRWELLWTGGDRD